MPKADNPGYGVFLWLNKQGGNAQSAGSPSAPPNSPGGFIYYGGYTDIVGALGAGINRLYIVPSLNAVIIRQSVDDSAEFLDNDFLELILPK